MRTSYSALSTYQTCPLKFKFQEIDKIKAPKSIEAVFGNAIHSSLRFMFERTPLYPTLDEVIDFFSNRWQDLAGQNQNNNDNKWDEQTIQAYFDDGIAILKKFYKTNQPWNFNVLDLESRFEVLIEDKKTNQSHILTGIIDRIDKTDDDCYEIIDYKTGRRMPPQNSVDQDLQMSIYHLGLIKRWPHLTPEKIKLSLYFLKHGEKIVTRRSPEQLEETKMLVINTINCLLYTSPSPRDLSTSRMPSSA